MNLFASYRLKRAAKRYALELPAQMQRDYGASEWYTPAQIQACVLRARLPVAFMMFGQAQYLPREVFDADVETEYSYDFLREMFQRHVAPSGAPGVEPAQMNAYAAAGAADVGGAGG